MNTRTDEHTEPFDADRGKPRLRMNYDVPLVWLLSCLLVVCGQAVNTYFAQQRQSELIAQQSELIKDLSAQIKAMGTAISAKDLKDVEHDIRITDHERRLQSLETKVRP